MINLFRPFVTEEAISAVNEVLRSGWIGLGQKTEEFERSFAEYVGAKYAVAVNSATSALHLALVINGITEGDEVLTTPFTFVSTNHVILYQKAVPVFIDIDPTTLNIDLNHAQRLITPKTKALIAVHFGGNPVAVDQLYDFARHHNLRIIEDAAHACGASFMGKKIGSFGCTCFSFHAVKNLPLGDGGMITTNDQTLYERLLRLRWVGIDRSTYSRAVTGKYNWEYDVTEVGFKYHMNDINAVMGIVHLRELDAWNKRRQEIVDIYRSKLGKLEGKLTLLKPNPDAKSANHLFVVRVPNRNAIVDRLKQRNINVGVHYKPNNHYEVYRDYDHGNLPEAEKAYEEVISLPLHLYLTDAEVNYVSDALIEILDDMEG